MKNLLTNHRLLFRYTLYSLGAFIVYFMAMLLFGLAGIPELRFLNYVIFFFLAYAALTELIFVRKVHFSYLEGIAFTFVLGALSFLAFGIFVLIFSVFNPFFLEIVGREMQSAARLGIWGPAFIVFAEGLGISSVVSLCMMQYFQAYSSRRSFWLRGTKLFENKNIEIGKATGKVRRGEAYS